MTNYFSELRNLAQKIDNDVQKLTKTWESPHLLVSGHGENVDDASPYVERFLGELKQVQDQLIDDRKSRLKYIANTDEYISSVENFYEDMKQQCDDVESMLIDCGYEPLHNDSECPPTDESETESGILTTSQMDHSLSLGSDFTDKSESDSYYTPRLIGNPPKSIATPVITSLASAMKLGQTRETDITKSLSRHGSEYYTPL